MNSNNGDMPLNIVGYAAKTEDIKAQLLKSVAELFAQTSAGSRKLPRESCFAEVCRLALMLASRCGADMNEVFREIGLQAKNGLALDDELYKDYRAVLSFVDVDYRRQRL
ncbi:MAG: hypothetical protein J6A07_04370 [Firmicutes bacterium]|nr:hypothetical protein [Bacillota bacterium]